MSDSFLARSTAALGFLGACHVRVETPLVRLPQHLTNLPSRKNLVTTVNYSSFPAQIPSQRHYGIQHTPQSPTVSALVAPSNTRLTRPTVVPHVVTALTLQHDPTIARAHSCTLIHAIGQAY